MFSALPPKADSSRTSRHVRIVPQTDSCTDRSRLPPRALRSVALIFVLTAAFLRSDCFYQRRRPGLVVFGVYVMPSADHYGELQAWDPATGKKVWSHNFPKSQLFGSVTATAGDLIFAGGTNDRNFRAFDAKTGELLWEQKTNSGIVGMPVAYEVDGTEYIAIQSGWGVDAQRIQDALTTNNIGLENNVPQVGVVWVFAVKK